MMKSTITKFVQKIKKDTEESTYQIVAFGVFGSISYLLFYALNVYFGDPHYENLTLRIVATILCILLVFHKSWPNQLKIVLPWFWHFTILYCLAFFFSYMLFQNHFTPSWLMNYVTILFLMMLLVDWKSFFILFILGLGLALLMYNATNSEPLAIVHMPIAQEDIIGTFIVTIIMGMIFIRGKKQYVNERIRGLKAGAGSIAHDLRTPLLSIKSISIGLESVLPKLFQTYEIANKANLEVPVIRKSKINILENASQRQLSEVDFSLNYIDLVLGNIKFDQFDTTNYHKLLMSEVLIESVDAFPFKDSQRNLVHMSINKDFYFIGNQFYFKNLVNNLIKNSLFFIKSEQKGEIYITCNDHELSIKDTAKGASPQLCKTMFEPYKSNRDGGTGLGLAFCKAVIESFGGTVRVESIEGEFINFIFTFTKVKN